jgi:hypothetical protein
VEAFPSIRDGHLVDERTRLVERLRRVCPVLTKLVDDVVVRAARLLDAFVPQIVGIEMSELGREKVNAELRAVNAEWRERISGNTLGRDGNVSHALAVIGEVQPDRKSGIEIAQNVVQRLRDGEAPRRKHCSRGRRGRSRWR